MSILSYCSFKLRSCRWTWLSQSSGLEEEKRPGQDRPRRREGLINNLITIVGMNKLRAAHFRSFPLYSSYAMLWLRSSRKIVHNGSPSASAPALAPCLGPPRFLSKRHRIRRSYSVYTPVHTVLQVLASPFAAVSVLETFPDLNTTSISKNLRISPSGV